MSGYRVTPDNGYVVFQGDLDTAGVLDLYSAPLAPASAPIPARLNGAPGSGGTLQRFTFTRGMSLDLSSGGATLSTLDTGTALSGLGSFDVLFFDACLMGMIESAYEVRNAADYFVAGQNLMFADLPYDDYLAPGALSANTQPLDLARRIVDRYNARGSATG